MLDPSEIWRKSTRVKNGKSAGLGFTRSARRSHNSRHAKICRGFKRQGNSEVGRNTFPERGHGKANSKGQTTSKRIPGSQQSSIKNENVFKVKKNNGRKAIYSGYTEGEK